MFRRVKLKVCGMKDVDNMRLLAGLRPDYVGFICYPLSSRYVGDTPQPELAAAVPAGTLKVGVFVDAKLEEVATFVEKLDLDLLQLHGSESPQLIGELKIQFPQIEIIKAIAVEGSDSFSAIGGYADCVDFFLFDTKADGYGGSGRKFNWSLLNEIEMSKPWFISGGIGPSDGQLVRELGNQYKNLFAVDINSQFEKSPGVKDIKMVKGFIETL